MRERPFIRQTLLATALMLALASGAWAAATIAQADGDARKALELKQYSAVVKSYDGVEPQLLTAQAFYRLAIAHQRLGQSVQAQSMLVKALEKNPAGSFTSSPARLELLRSDIQNGIANANAKAADAAIGGASASATTEELPVVAATALVAPAVLIPTASAPVVKVTDPVLASMEAATAPKQLPVAVASFVAASPTVKALQLVNTDTPSFFFPLTKTFILYTGLASGSLLGLIWLVFGLQKKKFVAQINDLQEASLQALMSMKKTHEGIYAQMGENFRDEMKAFEAEQARAKLLMNSILQASYDVGFTSEERRQHIGALEFELETIKSKPVSDVGSLVALRDELTKMRDLISAAGTTHSLLFSAISTLEPVVQMEIGRNHFRLNRNPCALVNADREKLATVMHLEPTPMNLDAAEPCEVMSYISSGPSRFLNALGLNEPAAVAVREVRAA